jgi:hypothetical protein
MKTQSLRSEAKPHMGSVELDVNASPHKKIADKQKCGARKEEQFTATNSSRSVRQGADDGVLFGERDSTEQTG